MTDKPIIVQNDNTVLLETGHGKAEEARKALNGFADLWKSPEHLHTYRITPLSLWNAAASGWTADSIVHALSEHAKFGVPKKVEEFVTSFVNRFGLLRLVQEGSRLLLTCDDETVLRRIEGYGSMFRYFDGYRELGAIGVKPAERGEIKQELLKLGYPVEDVAGYAESETVPIRIRTVSASGKPFQLRDYQERAVEAFYRGGSAEGGSGVLVLPCGAGKTVIGIFAMARLGCATLILTSNSTSVRQWKEELLDKTELTEEEVGEYGGDRKQVKPITIATYQMLTHRKSKDSPYSHMRLFRERSWGLIIYDEVHMLPAPVFRATAEIQATRRLGLTATLIREDSREDDVFSLVGPKRFEVPWKELEAQGWIADVRCREIRVSMDEATSREYRGAASREQHRIAGENVEKLKAVERLLSMHDGEQTLVIGQYLDQLHRISEQFGAPLITGETPHEQREVLYRKFKRGELRLLVVSKVANFAIDLPDASVAIQVSGSFGSRQEEAQRLGRVLRPKRGDNTAYFYTVVTKDSREQDYALKRQMFLVEQGYRYQVADAAEKLLPEEAYR
ncbi:DNA repair helicase XPB [Paenibacillus thermotolerans]|uniref:DNA repair helicase XPB n=1 Tax=Paenibacillus thermotolerans TaxID=3027807 RepID=UPI002368A7AD|nr:MULTISPECIES: DNA repair helicase XPB [unclassified Paenibacillus]